MKIQSYCNRLAGGRIRPPSHTQISGKGSYLVIRKGCRLYDITQTSGKGMAVMG